MVGRISTSWLSWLGLAAAPLALAVAVVSPSAGLAGGAAIVLLAAFGWTRGESRLTAGVAALGGLAALVVADGAFLILVMAGLAALALRATARSIMLARQSAGGSAS